MPGVITCTLTGEPAPGDEIFWYWCDARGGRSECCTIVIEGDTNESIVARMVGRSNWTSTLSLAAKGNTIICIPQSGAPAGSYPTEVRGKGTAKLTVSE